MLKSKKGIEPVIATVLLIVITIAIVGLVVAFVVPYIQGIMDKQSACSSVKLEIDTSGTCTNNTATKVMVGVGLGDFNMSKILVQVTSAGKTNAVPKIKGTDPFPAQGGAETYVIANGNATKVGAVPYVVYNKKEYVCDNGKAELSSVQRCA